VNLYIGPLALYVEAIFSTLAFAVFIWWALKGLKRENIKISKENLLLFFIIIILGGYFFGWLWYYIEYVVENVTFISPFGSGVTSYGMFFGGIFLTMFLAFWYNKKYKIEKSNMTFFGRITDALVPAGAMFVFVYRMGCFLYGDVPGVATSVPWGILATYQTKFGELIRHPVALYLSFSGLLIFIILHAFFSYKKTKKTKFGKRFHGETALWFVLLYSFNRFLIEFFAEGHNYEFVTRYFGLYSGQWALGIAFFGILACLIIGYARFNRSHKT